MSARTWPRNGPVLKGGRVQGVPLTPHSAAQIVKACARRAGLDAQGFAGHSLRSGFLTSAAEAGASVFKMTEVSDLFREHAGSAFL
jgi:site-specific recombinase XerD